ncbi:hypothetical protein [Algivirga pacifica]|uniref:Peptidase M61 n=1 Tax=Algivirga pacifica TaxID=1162670 RepID=A0ABP9CYK1_9BACT
MNRVGLWLMLLFLSVQVRGQETFSYHYELDLNKVKNDRLTVRLKVPSLKEKEEVTFHLPAVVPGTYAYGNYGRFVVGLRFLDEKGKSLKGHKVGENSWKCTQPSRLREVVYQVNDTWDFKDGGGIFPPAGSNITQGENYVINPFAFFGYFEGYEEYPYQLSVRHDSELYGASALKDQDERDEWDLFQTENYGQLADSPILYAKADTVQLMLGEGTEIEIAVYSTNGELKATMLQPILEKVLRAQQDYLGGQLPVERYAFLFYFNGDFTMGGLSGALEHNYSSFYFLPEYKGLLMEEVLTDIAAHEFFHILTPLKLHAKEIRYFNFHQPEMSRHLWLYEGVTEYLAHHMQVHQGLIEGEDFLQRMMRKAIAAHNTYNDSLPFTVLSKECLTTYKDQYPNVYEKGALIGMAIDLTLLKYTQGEMGLRELLFALINRYGEHHPFTDEELISAMIEESGVTYFQEFYERYLEGGEPLPLTALLEEVGVRFALELKEADYTLGNVEVDLNEKRQLYVTDIEQMDSTGIRMGYQKGDILLELQGRSLEGEDFLQVLDEEVSRLKEGDQLSVLVLRGGEKKQLKAEVCPIYRHRVHVVEGMEEVSDEQKRMRQRWLGAGDLE